MYLTKCLYFLSEEEVSRRKSSFDFIRKAVMYLIDRIASSLCRVLYHRMCHERVTILNRNFEKYLSGILKSVAGQFRCDGS